MQINSKQAQRAAPNLPNKSLCEALSIFSGTFNKRPDHDLYYSEKLITLKQKLHYEQAIQTLKAITECND